VALTLICAVSVAIRLPFFSVPLITDEGGYAYVAHWLGRGLSLYRDLWFDRPQGIFLIFSAQMALLGESTEAIRLGAALYNAGSAVALFALGASLHTPFTGLAAAALFGIASASPAIEGFTANGELYMNLPLLISLGLASRRRWLAAGVLLAFACAVKPTAIAGAAPTVAVLLLWPQDGMRPVFHSVVRHAAFFASGAVLGALPFIVHGLSTDPYLYFYSVIGFRFESHSAFSAGTALLGDLGQTAPTVLAALAPLWLIAAIGVFRAWRTRIGAVAIAYCAGSFLGAAAGGYWYWHYYSALVPGAALLAGAAIDRALGGQLQAGELLARVVAVVRRPRLPADALAIGSAVLSVGLSTFFNVRLMGETPEETSWLIYHRPAYMASREVAAYLRENTSEGDGVYAAFAQADLYYLSGRRSAGRHLYWTEINRVPGALDDVIETLDDPARRPVYVIQIDRELEASGRAAAFWERVSRNYVPERQIGGITLHRKRSAGPA
jgi:hypothetical protein